MITPPRRMITSPTDPGPEPEPRVHTGHLIRRAQQQHLALWQQYVSADVSSVQFAVMSFLERNPGASQSALGAELDVDRSTVTDLVTRMKRHGLLQRLPHDVDRRRYMLSLTEAGCTEVARLRPLVDLANDRLTAGLSQAERVTLRALLRRLVSQPD